MTVNQATEYGVKRFQDDRFGMFVHWGLYSLIGASEWVMFHRRYSVSDYEQLAQKFEASEFSADKIARIAADAGQRYLTITSRHHDGFSMYDTAHSDYKVTNTPFGRDPLAELAKACREHSVRLGFYVSLLDWHHPAYRASLREKSGLAWDDYLGFLFAQVRELCTAYGDVAEFWLDGFWPVGWPAPRFPNWFEGGGDFRLPQLFDLIHELQPDAVIMNNRHSAPVPGEDVQGYEGDIPGENTHLNLNNTPPMLAARESCQTLTREGYGYQRDNHDYRSLQEVAQMLMRAAGAGANLLLNVGPTPQGTISGPAADRLARLGAWLRVNGEGLYGTREGVLTVTDEHSDPPAPAYVACTRSTVDSAVHYIHLLDGSVPSSVFIDLPRGMHAAGAAATLLHDGGDVPVHILADGDTLRLTVPADRRDGLITSVRLQIS